MGNLTLDDLQHSILTIEINQNDKIDRIVMSSSTFEKFKKQYKNYHQNNLSSVLSTLFGIAIDIDEFCKFPVLIGESNRHYALRFKQGYDKNNKLKFILEER